MSAVAGIEAVEFRVYGEPIPQGSKTVGTGKGGRSWVREDNPRTEPWRNAVAAAGAKAMDGAPPLTGPLSLIATFFFKRPQTHYRTGKHAGELKPNAPRYCGKRPDLDKLLRALGDALTGSVVTDDAAIAEVLARKRYDGPPGVIVRVEPLWFVGGLDL